MNTHLKRVVVLFYGALGILLLCEVVRLHRECNRLYERESSLISLAYGWTSGIIEDLELLELLGTESIAPEIRDKFLNTIESRYRFLKMHAINHNLPAFCENELDKAAKRIAEIRSAAPRSGAVYFENFEQKLPQPPKRRFVYPGH
jgi:hypothetical protein